jgi:hypothetical protein
MRRLWIIAVAAVVLVTVAVVVPLVVLGGRHHLSAEDQRICEANAIAYNAAVLQQGGDPAVLDGVREAVQAHSQARDPRHASPVLRAGVLVAFDSLAVEAMGASPTDRQLADMVADIEHLHQVCRQEGGTSGGPAPQPVTKTTAEATEPANPVPILKQTGATPEPGTRVGSRGASNDLYAEGYFGDSSQVATNGAPPGQEQNMDSIVVEVRTFVSNDARDEFLTSNGSTSTDDQAIIAGRAFLVLMSWTYATDHPHPFNPSPETIAERVGGQVQ